MQWKGEAEEGDILEIWIILKNIVLLK
jgi:hypothetical protein